MQSSYNSPTMAAASQPLRKANWPLHQLPGLDASDCDSLKSYGVQTTADLLAVARPPADRQKLLAHLQCHPQYLSKWIALADLSQIPGVGVQYCGLLLHAGVGSSLQLARMEAGQLHRTLLRLQVSLFHSRQHCPEVGQVRQWIQQARGLSR